MKTLTRTIAIALLALPMAVLASGNSIEKIRKDQTEIRKQIESEHGKYHRYSPAARDRIAKAQKRVERIIDGVSTVDQLNPVQQAELSNSLEHIKAEIVQNDDDRQVCERERRIGSQRKTIVCATVAERRAIAEEARTWKADPSNCMGSCGGE